MLTMEKTVSVVYHSGYGHTQKQAEAIAAGAGEDSSTKVNLISVDDLKDPESASWTILDESDALVFGSPTYMGSVSADLKAFMELHKCFKICRYRTHIGRRTKNQGIRFI